MSIGIIASSRILVLITFKITLKRIDNSNTSSKEYVFELLNPTSSAPTNFGDIVIVGTVRFEEIGSVTQPYTGQCTVLRTQDVNFSYNLSYPYDENITSYVNSINPYNFNGFQNGCSDPVNKLGVTKVDFDTFTNNNVVTNGNVLKVIKQIKEN
jgi:hypothetical protein